jgi:hypothetical protein
MTTLIRFPLATAVVAWLLLAPPAASAQEQDMDSAIAACLKAWGTHPFAAKPKYRTMQTSVKVFGIGGKSGDTEKTAAPSLVLVNPGVNVMGGTTVELLNPNGWYCLRSTVNVMGGLTLRAHCDAHIASSADGATVMGSNTENKGVTVMGATRVERTECK